MNVIYGEENRELIGEKFTTLELDTMLYSEEQGPIPLFAVVGPDDLTFENIAKLKQMIPVHEALIKNYKEQNWVFCLQAIEKLIDGICPFMDTFYYIMRSRINTAIANPDENWTGIVDMTHMS